MAKRANAVGSKTFGVSWQIVPKNICELISTQAGFDAMSKMKKLDIATLEAAASGP